MDEKRHDRKNPPESNFALCFSVVPRRSNHKLSAIKKQISVGNGSVYLCFSILHPTIRRHCIHTIFSENEFYWCSRCGDPFFYSKIRSSMLLRDAEDVDEKKNVFCNWAIVWTDLHFFYHSTSFSNPITLTHTSQINFEHVLTTMTEGITSRIKFSSSIFQCHRFIFLSARFFSHHFHCLEV